ncbi:protein kinase [Candidatus Obscuribacterales bacterium]|nr:protein kinase [Candidatus Obscuribacterales bacterium]
MTTSDSEVKKVCIACGKDPSTCQCSTVKVSIEDAMKAMDAAALKSGDIEGRYRILEKVGVGGMGTVYRAEHVVLRREVAIKVLRSELLMDSMAMARFEQESRACAALSHPNLVAVYDCGINALSQPYLVMEFLRGKSLMEIIKESGPLPLNQFFEVFIEVAAALEYAHQNHVIHRDLKPSNILLSEDPRGGMTTKIVDFGVAKIEDLGGEFQMLTRTGEVFGSPAYMSPEQCQGNQVDNRSDIYAIGCVMYEALCGKQAFKGANIMTIMTKQMEDDPVPPEHIDNGEGLPADVQLMVMTCLRKDPAERFQSMKELKEELERLQHNASANRPVRLGSLTLPAVFIPIMVSLAVLACIFSFSSLMPGGSVDRFAGSLRSPMSKAMLATYTHMRHMRRMSIDTFESMLIGPQAKSIGLADKVSIAAVLFDKLNQHDSTRKEILPLYGKTVGPLLNDVERAASSNPNSLEGCRWSAPLVYNYVGLTYEKNRQYADAEARYKRGLALANQLESPLWVRSKLEQALGEVYLHQKFLNLDAAIPLLENSLKHLRAEKKAVREQRNEALTDTAEALYKALTLKNKPKEAVAVLEGQVDYLRKQEIIDSGSIARLTNSIIDFYRSSSQWETADKWRKELAKINPSGGSTDRGANQSKASDTVRLANAWSLRNEQSPWHKIMEAYKAAIERADDDLDKFAIALLAFDTTCEYSLYDDAKDITGLIQPALKRTQESVKAAANTSTQEVSTGQAPMALFYLAFTEYKQGAYPVAVKHLALARELVRGQPDETFVSGRLDALEGNMALTLKQYKDAEQLLKRAVQELKDGGGAKNFRVADTLVLLGRVYMELRNFSAAKECFNEATTIYNTEPWKGWNMWHINSDIETQLIKMRELEKGKK